MSKYTTGEMAKLCDVTVRTVQYYDKRGILVPTELSEGGRRLYSEDDVKRLKIICFLKELGLPLDSISQILSEKDPGSLIFLLLEQQKQELKTDIEAQHKKLDKLESLQKELKSIDNLSVESIGDVAYTMSNKKNLKRIHRTMLLSAVPITVLQWTSIIMWIINGWWLLFAVWLIIAIPYAIVISRYYFKNVAYLCPQCHTVFKPSLKQAFWARHTPTTRKLTCAGCGHNGFCVEVVADDENKKQ